MPRLITLNFAYEMRHMHQNVQNESKNSAHVTEVSFSILIGQNSFAAESTNMAAWSKVLHCSCHELGHTWTTSCVKAALEVGYHGYKQSFKIYAPLYLVSEAVSV